MKNLIWVVVLAGCAMQPVPEGCKRDVYSGAMKCQNEPERSDCNEIAEGISVCGSLRQTLGMPY